MRISLSFYSVLRRQFFSIVTSFFRGRRYDEGHNQQNNTHFVWKTKIEIIYANWNFQQMGTKW